MEDPSDGLGAGEDVKKRKLASDKKSRDKKKVEATEDVKKRKRASDKKSRDKKKQHTKDIESKLETIKVENVELEKSKACMAVQLYHLEKELEQRRETQKIHEKLLEGQAIMIQNMLQQILQPPLERTLDNTFATREGALPVHHTPFYQSGIAMGLGCSTMTETFGIPQSQVSQGWARENSSELRALTHEDQHLNVDGYLVDHVEIPALKQQ